MPKRSYYDILQVSPTAEPEVIQAAYKRLAFKYHPDRNSNPGSQEMMRLLNEAYRILSDAKRRAAYDAKRQATTSKQTSEGAQANADPAMPEQSPIGDERPEFNF